MAISEIVRKAMYFLNDYLLNPEQRIFWLYLLSSASIAFLFQYFSRDGFSSPLSQYWLHPSALLDYRYFVVSWLIKIFILMPLIVPVHEVSVFVYHAILTYLPEPIFTQSPFMASVTYTVALFVVGEFSRYWLHRFLHTVPWLWQFHKVHHTPSVLTPLTFYRVHPIENWLFGLRYALSAGLVTGVCLALFGHHLSIQTIAGANIFIFIFNMIGGNLRHSHIFLRYPAWLEKWFMSPAQHQLHHSRQYMQRNYGGYLAIWDTLFGTVSASQGISQTPKFGISEVLERRYQSIIELLWQPFLDCSMLWRKKYAKEPQKRT